MNIGDEPDFLTPWLYNFINKSYKTVERVRGLVDGNFNDGPQGIPGNSDAGALNTWGLWAMLGLYPLVPTTVYLLSSPYFPEVNVSVNHDRTLSIVAHGLDTGTYVQSVSVNGQDWGKNWIDHSDVMVEGGTIEFFLGPEATQWETGEAPPSPGHVQL